MDKENEVRKIPEPISTHPSHVLIPEPIIWYTKDGKTSHTTTHEVISQQYLSLSGSNTEYGSLTAMTSNQPADEHCHHDRGDLVDRRARRKLIIASVLCVFFMIAEVIGGILSHSLAIATDAAHLLTDFAGFMISLFSLWMSTRKPTRLMPFGWHRAEVIGALTSVLTIWIVTGILVYMAIERIVLGNYEIDAFVMLVTSAVGVVVNLVMGMTLHQHSHSHGGHHHNQLESELPLKKNKKNINVRAAFIHVLGDLIQSVGVLIAAIVIYYRNDWKIVDPICTFLFSFLVLMTTFSIIKDALIVLMEGMPRDVDFNDVLNTFLDIEGVVAVHNLRIWALSLDKAALAAHLAIKPGATPQDILKTASQRIHQKYNFFEMTLQIENFSQKMEECVQCQDSSRLLTLPDDSPRKQSKLSRLKETLQEISGLTRSSGAKASIKSTDTRGSSKQKRKKSSHKQTANLKDSEGSSSAAGKAKQEKNADRSSSIAGLSRDSQPRGKSTPKERSTDREEIRKHGKTNPKKKGF
ncbi:zinc transporter 2-like isoform X2 [Cimex lectularius]|uniref:Zinc transporter n=1 Tax=Cimex lectularius TaxID=79782 RepID=A0A8I6SDR2_CIMLE|nr:zinc transporter 2-like isoform X2 [Cimex lectularius]